MIESIHIENFTCFEDLKIDFVDGVNIFIGDNGTGKTHILKWLYSVIVSKTKLNNSKNYQLSYKPFENEVIKIFKVYGDDLLRKSKTKKNQSKIIKGSIKISGVEPFIHEFDTSTYKGKGNIIPCNINGVYIPAKDMLANAPYFLSTFDKYDIHFEKVYSDI